MKYVLEIHQLSCHELNVVDLHQPYWCHFSHKRIFGNQLLAFPAQFQIIDCVGILEGSLGSNQNVE